MVVNQPHAAVRSVARTATFLSSFASAIERTSPFASSKLAISTAKPLAWALSSDDCGCDTRNPDRCGPPSKARCAPPSKVLRDRAPIRRTVPQTSTLIPGGLERPPPGRCHQVSRTGAGPGYQWRRLRSSLQPLALVRPSVPAVAAALSILRSLTELHLELGLQEERFVSMQQVELLPSGRCQRLGPQLPKRTRPSTQ